MNATNNLSYYRNAQLVVNIMHVNNVLFLVSICNYLYYSTTKAVDNMKALTLEDRLRNIIFLLIQFKYMKDRNLLGITISIVHHREYLKYQERFYYVVEKHSRCCYAIIPYNLLLSMIVVQLIITMLFISIPLSSRKDISKILFPLSITEGINLDYNLYFRVIFRELIQTYERTRNDITPRYIDIITLGCNQNL